MNIGLDDFDLYKLFGLNSSGRVLIKNSPLRILIESNALLLPLFNPTTKNFCKSPNYLLLENQVITHTC